MPHDRFWAKVQKTDGCWLFTGAKGGGGYGVFWLDGRQIPAHRFAWTEVNGELPPGFILCHHCDNPPCIRPDHIFPGTYADNMRDAAEKGRMPTGEKHGSKTHPEAVLRGEDNANARLNPDVVRSIRAAYQANGATVSAISRRFDIDRATVRQIVHRRTWRHVA